MKRFLFLLIAFAFSFVAPANGALAEEKSDAPDISTPYCIVVDANDPTCVFFERDADEICVPGSTMKIMTCILALELCEDLDGTIVIASGQAATMSEENSLMHVLKNEPLTMRELLYGLMLESGNDAALLIAQTIGGDVAGYAELANAKAAELGMTNSHFLNGSGAYRSGQYSTARDMAILTCYAMQNEQFREIVSCVNYTIEPNSVRTRALDMINSNKLISDDGDSRYHCELAIGVKTGSTSQGGKCLVSAGELDGARVVAVLLGAKDGGSKNERMNRVYLESKALLEYTLNTRYAQIAPEDLGLCEAFVLPVTDAVGGEGSFHAEFETDALRLPDLAIAAMQSTPSCVVREVAANSLFAPIAAGERVGAVTYSFRGIHMQAALVASEDVAIAITTPSIQEATPAISLEPAFAPEQASFTPWIAMVAGAVLLALVFALVVLIRRARTASGKKAKRR